MIVFDCPSCQHQLKVKDEMAGKRGRCPNCRQSVVVPGNLAPGASVLDSPTLAPARTGARRDPDTPSPSPGVPRSIADANTAPGVAPHGAADPQKIAREMLAPPQASDELGRLGPYRVLRVLGVGGMGIVFQGKDTRLLRPVALKAMLPALTADAANRQRFLREAQAAASINHDHIVTIYEVGEHGGVPYFAMQFLEGEPLDQRLQREGRLPVAEAMRIGREVAEGLAAAHARGLIHRDIKPANIWLESGRGRVKILDFGLARPASDTTHLTQQGAIIGTPAYMAPEQVRGKNMDGRVDLFSLGCVLYRMCTGALPFEGDDTLAILLALATHVPPPIDQLSPQVPRALADLVQRLLAKAPEERPATAPAVAEEIARIEKGEAPAAEWPRFEAVSSRPAPTQPKMPMPPGLAPTQRISVEGAHDRPDTSERDEAPERRPRSKKKARKRKQTSVGLWIGLAVVGLVLVGLVVVLLVVVRRNGDSGTSDSAGNLAAPTSSDAPATFRVVDVSATPLTVAAPRGKGPLDRFDPAAIAPVDRVAIPGLVAVLHRDGGEGWSVEFSPDGKYLASGGNNRKLCFWDLSRPEAGAKVLPIGGEGAVAFSPDSRKLFASAPALQGWDLAADAPLTVPDRFSGRLALAYSRDGAMLAVGERERLSLVDPRVSPVRVVHQWKWHRGAVRRLAFTQTNDVLASCGEDKSVCFWDVTATPPKYLHGIENKAQCQCVALSPDGQMVAFGDQDGNVHVWDLHLREVRGHKVFPRWSKKGHLQWASGIVVTPDGRRVISSGGGASSRGPHVAVVWDAAKGDKLAEWTLPERCAGLAIDPTGQYVALGCHNSNIYIVRLGQ
jgi:serine/threonine protein kinase/WD40 repeat protein